MEFESPGELSQWLQDNFKYKAEEFLQDYWQTPEETLELKTGDCEDFAFLVLYILNQQTKPKEAYFVLIDSGEVDSHAICVFKKEDGTWGIFSDRYYFSMGKDSILGTISAYNSKWIKINVCAVSVLYTLYDFLYCVEVLRVDECNL